MTAMCGQIIVFRVSKYFSKYGEVAECAAYSDMQDTLNSILKGGQDSERWTGCGTGALSSPSQVMAGSLRHRENRENDHKKSVRENTGKLEILPKHREFGLLRL